MMYSSDWEEDDDIRRCDGCGAIEHEYGGASHNLGCPVRAKKQRAEAENTRWNQQRAGTYRCGCVVSAAEGITDPCFGDDCEIFNRTYRLAGSRSGTRNGPSCYLIIGPFERWNSR